MEVKGLDHYNVPLGCTDLSHFDSVVLQHPERFASRDDAAAEAALGALRSLYRFAKATEPRSMSELPELLTDGFTEDQVWEELELQNKPMLKFLKRRCARLLEEGDQVQLLDERLMDRMRAMEATGDTDSESDGDQEGSAGGGTDEDEEDEDEELEDEEQEDEEQEDAGPVSGDRAESPDPDIEEDEFFSVADMERFADQQDEELEKEQAKLDAVERGAAGTDDFAAVHASGDEDEEEEEEEEGDVQVNLFALDLGGNNEGTEAMAQDFFVGARPRRRGEGTKGAAADGSAAAAAEDEEEEEEGGKRKPETLGSLLPDTDDEEEGEGEEDEGAGDGEVTAYQKQQRQLRERIKGLEGELVAAKEWNLKGETSGRQRPENSLLETYLEYDTATRGAPEVTVESTTALEDVIKQRILDEAFDDVEPRDAPSATTVVSQNKVPEVSQERSKKGLGELYEEDFLRDAMGYQPEPEQRKKERELASLFRRITSKLDALSNYHYTPKAHIPEMSVKPSVPAIAMEEVLPLTVADSATAAPEEVMAKERGRQNQLRGDTEKTREDRRADRRARKTSKRREKRQREADVKRAAKLNPALGNKYAKEKMLESLRMAKNVSEGKAAAEAPGSYTKSRKFFEGLQKEARKEVHGGDGEEPASKRQRKKKKGSAAGEAASLKL